MKTPALAVACALALTLGGCLNANQQRDATGALIGGGLGFLTAKAFDADDGWVVLTTLAGAAAGTVVARNTANNTCAYATGDGRYREGPC